MFSFVIEDIPAFFVCWLGENNFVLSNKILPFSIKSINPVQKDPHIVESFACILYL